MGTYGQELLVETFGHMLGAITIVCGALCATPPTSIVGVILWTGWLGEAVLSHLRIGHLPVVFISLGLYVPLMVWVALWPREKASASRCPFKVGSEQVTYFARQRSPL